MAESSSQMARLLARLRRHQSDRPNQSLGCITSFSLHAMQRIRTLLEQLRDQLSVGGEDRFAGDVDAALASCDDAVAAFVMSDGLWGDAGSIADQALGGRSAARGQLEQLLIELGHEQIARGYTNPRTQIWISAFHHWHTRPSAQSLGRK